MRRVALAGLALVGALLLAIPSAFAKSDLTAADPGITSSSIGSVQTMWSNNAGSIGGSYNAAYDVWFSTSATGDSGAPSGGYLMVWFYDPQAAQPIGLDGTGHATSRSTPSRPR